jgi:hypothetical protein
MSMYLNMSLKLTRQKAGVYPRAAHRICRKIACKGFNEASVEQICEAGLISFSLPLHSSRREEQATARFVAQFISVPIRFSYGLGNLTPKRSATTSGASRDRETGNPCSRHALSPPSSTHTLSTPMRFNATATRALNVSPPEEE